MGVNGFLSKLAALAKVVLLVAGMVTNAEAYGCQTPSLCDGFNDADVVLWGYILRRSEEANDYGDFTYAFNPHYPYYKTEPGVNYWYEVLFTTHSSSALCGVDPQPGQRYVIGMYRHGEELTAYSCGLLVEWDSVTEEEKATLEAGCIFPLCDEVCDDFETCMEYPSGSGVYRCMELCAAGVCADGETCTVDDDLMTAKCTTFSDGT